MPKLDLDFGGINEIPPEGCWRFVVDDAEVKQNKAKDGHLIDIVASMVDAPEDKFEGFKPFPHPMLSLKTSARWKLQEGLEAITQRDWKDDNMSIEVDDDNKVNELIGKTFLAICTHESYNGRMNFRVDTYISDNGEVQIGQTLESAPTGL